MLDPRSIPFRRALWSRMLLAAGVLTVWALSGARPVGRPQFAVAALQRAGGSATARPIYPLVPPSATPRHRAAAPAPVSVPKAQMLALINAERAQAGVGPLTFDPTLNTIAQARSQDMVARHYFAHEIPGMPGVHMVFDLLDRANVSYQMAGENLALNNYMHYYPLTQTIQQTNTDLMHSPEHRANLLEPAYTRIGLGLAFEPGTDTLILTEVFVQP